MSARVHEGWGRSATQIVHRASHSERGHAKAVAASALTDGLERAMPQIASLSAPERITLRLMAMGLENQEIASRQGVSVRTVKNQITSMFRKLGLSANTGHPRARLAYTVGRWDGMHERGGDA